MKKVSLSPILPQGSLRSVIIHLACLATRVSSPREPPDPDMEWTPKDLLRIKEIEQKAGGDKARMLQLARAMARRITDSAKAYRRGRAAEDENFHDVARIFFDRHVELETGQPVLS